MKKKILAIDDDECVLYIVKKALSSSYEVTTTSDPVEFLIAFKNSSPDFIIVDLVMPKRSGIQQMQDIRATGSKIPILVCSGSTSPEAFTEALKLGNRFLRKPCNQFDILSEIEALVA